MQVQSKHGRANNLNFRTFENLVRRRAVKERDEMNKRKGNNCPWRGFCETDKGRKWSEERAERGKQRGGQERKGYRCSRRDYPIYCYLPFYQLTAAEGTGRNNFYECALVCCCWWFQGSSLSFYRGPANRTENMMVARRQTSQTSGGYWTEMRRSSSLLLLTFLSLQHL